MRGEVMRTEQQNTMDWKECEENELETVELVNMKSKKETLIAWLDRVVREEEKRDNKIDEREGNKAENVKREREESKN